METSRCLPLVQGVRCSPGLGQDGAGCGLESSSASFLFAVTPSARAGLLLVDARLEPGRGAGPVGWLEGRGPGSSSHGLGPPHLRGEAQRSGGERQVYRPHSGDRQERIHTGVLGRERESPPPAG